MACIRASTFSRAVKSFRRDPAEDSRAHSLHAPMMPLLAPDPVLNFPAGTNLNPQLLLRNATASPLPVALALDWHDAGQSGRLPLGSLTLNANEVRQVSLSSLLGNSQLPADAYWGTITANYSGLAGDLVPIALAFDSTGRYGLQTPFDEVKGKLFKGSMWHVDANRNSLITAGNTGPAPTRAALTLFYNAGKGRYTIEKFLNPGEQLWADVGQLIRNQLPDKDGNLIPAGTTMGSYELRDLDHRALGQLYEGKLVLDKTWGHGYYGCANCCGDSNISLLPGQYFNPVGYGTGNEVDGTNTCESTIDDLTDYAYNWYSTTTDATVQNAWTQLVGIGSGNARTSVDYTRNDFRLHQCPTATTSPFAPVQGTNDPTPNIVSVSPNPWPAGSVNLDVTISGSGFGTAPSVTLQNAPATVSYSISSASDSTIHLSVTVDPTDIGEPFTLSVTSSGYNGFGFASGGNSATSSNFNVNTTPIPAPVPQIIYNGQNIAGGATIPNVVVGQQIQLTTQVDSPLAVVSSLWTIPGTLIGGYTPAGQTGALTSGAIIVPTFSSPSITYYWTAAGGQAQIQYQITYQYCLTNQQCNSATATFKVFAPTNANIQPDLGNVVIGTTADTCVKGQDTPPCLVLGGSLTNIGIQFTWSATPPPGYSGQY